MTLLRQRMIDDMVSRNFTQGTQDLYLRAVQELAKHFGQSPDMISDEEIRAFLLYLTRTRNLSPTTRHTYAVALRFFYGVTLEKPERAAKIIVPRKQRKLPVVLSMDEVKRFFAAITSVKWNAFLMVSYGAGLRNSEIRHLKVSDIDSERTVIRIRQGKGQKDRYSILSPNLLKVLRTYWTAAKPKDWLFPGKVPGKPTVKNAFKRIIQRAARDAGISKHVTCHTLRHSFSTHLLEAGVDIRIVQMLLGHRSISSTAHYTQVSTHLMRKAVSPLDQLFAEGQDTKS